ncbi:MAG: hypothetical protein WKF31_11780 [Thermoleophilaceae bacterium]
MLHEHERAAAGLVAELGDEGVELGVVDEVHEAMLDLDRHRLDRRAVHVAAGVARGVGGGHAAGLALERGREEQGLTLARRLGHDAVDGGLEAHVEHAVGLVEHEHVHVRERELAALEQVLEAAGRGGHDVRLRGRAGPGARMPTPPWTTAVDSAREWATVRISSTIWQASSRVGARIRPAGRRASAAMRSTIGTPKASVLPEPVGDWARTSWPARTSAITSRLDGEGGIEAALGERAHDRVGYAEIGEGRRGHTGAP